MRDEVRHIVVGAVLGAILGATAAWVYGRLASTPSGREGSGAVTQKRAPLNSSQLMRLGWNVVGVVRQLVELR